MPWLECPTSDDAADLVARAREAYLEGWAGVVRVVNAATGEVVETIRKR